MFDLYFIFIRNKLSHDVPTAVHTKNIFKFMMRQFFGALKNKKFIHSEISNYIE